MFKERVAPVGQFFHYGDEVAKAICAENLAYLAIHPGGSGVLSPTGSALAEASRLSHVRADGSDRRAGGNRG